MALSRHRGPNKPRQKSVKGDTVTGSKWVGNNWEALAEAAELNGGQVPFSISLITSDFPNKNIWSEENLPAILFYLTPPPSSYEGQDVETSIRDDGKRLRSFEILPDRISVNVKGWLLEAWRRLDPRISYEDIIERMTADPEFCQGKGLSIPSKNSLQMHTLRSCRKLLGYWQLEGQKEEPSRAMVEAIEKLAPYNLLYNTVLPICEHNPNRLVKLKFERKTEDGQFKAVPLVVTPDNISKVTLPLNFFCQHLQDNASALVVSVDRAWETLLILQERADIHGLSHWSKLHKNCRPISWQTRTKGAIPDNRPADDKDGDDRTKAHTDTYDGGCSVCTWRPKSEGANLGEHDHSVKRQRADESDEEPVARRLRTETYGINLTSLSSGTSEATGLVHSSSSGYLSVRGQDHGYLNPPSTPLRYGGTKMTQPINSSPPIYYPGVPQASQSVVSSGHSPQGMSAGFRMTPMLPRPGLPRSNTDFMNVGCDSALIQPRQAPRPWTMHQQFNLAHDDFHHTTPSMLPTFSDWSPGTVPNASVSFDQSASDISTEPGPEQIPVKSLYHGPSGQSWQHLPNVQRRTMDLQHALGNPCSHDLQRYGPSEASHSHCRSVWAPTLYASKGHGRHEISPRIKHVQYHDPMFTGPATPQYPYEPSLSDSGHASFSDSSQDTLPNMDWDDDVFRFMLHSDEANEPPTDVINALSSLPNGAAVKELGSPLSMHAAKHHTVDRAEDHQSSHDEPFINQSFLDQLQSR